MKDQIKATLKENRYNLGHLCHHMGYSKTHVSLVLNKKRPGTLRFFFILCATINEMCGSSYTTHDFEDYIQ